MSLINAESQPCSILTKAMVPDGNGAVIASWVKTNRFDAVITAVSDCSDAKSVGNKEVSSKTYKVLYPNDVTLKLNDAIIGLNDNKVYRITADGTKSANTSTLKYSIVSAEDWSLPDDEI